MISTERIGIARCLIPNQMQKQNSEFPPNARPPHTLFMFIRHIQHPHSCHPERSLSPREAGRKQAKDLCIRCHPLFSSLGIGRYYRPSMHRSFVGSPSRSEGLRFLRMTELFYTLVIPFPHTCLCSSVTYNIPHSCHPERSLSSREAGRKQAKDLCIRRHPSTTFTS
jgi:hypothetical protein